ncbi:MAG: Crp/Fnr family transcriptional regulator [Patescibacteria group bacterium]|nr:Crp/Fnr family transcriptional regulator [Patescibacteria group bacterium]
MNNRKPKNLVDFFLEQKPRSYKKGQIFLRPDDDRTEIFYLEKGFVKAYSLTEEGDQKTHIIFKKGDIFPLVSIFAPPAEDVFFETIDETILRKLGKKGFLDFIKKDNKFLFEVIEKIAALMRVYIDTIDSLEYIKADARIIDHLLFLSERFGKKQRKKILIQVPLTHKDIAESTAISRETASREIELLKRKKLIDNTSKHFIIKDIEKLKKELLFHRDFKKL